MNSKRRAIERILRTKLEDKTKTYIINRIKILRDKGCWVVSEDWSVYSGGRLHRKMYEQFGGVLISGKMICHTCDRPGCINPEHLFQGTNQDNMNDAISKGRRYRSSPEGKAKRIAMKKLREEDRWMQLRRFCW